METPSSTDRLTEPTPWDIPVRSLVYTACLGEDRQAKIAAVFAELEPAEWPAKLAAIVGSPS